MAIILQKASVTSGRDLGGRAGLTEKGSQFCGEVTRRFFKSLRNVIGFSVLKEHLASMCRLRWCGRGEEELR